jgi:autoinducer 2-degrading protein
MHIVLVAIHVKPEGLEEFLSATRKNAENSLKESGVVRFDMLQQQDDPCRFVLVEVYRQSEDAAKHKETSHYLAWRDRVAGLMAEPRQGIRYVNIMPDDRNWN